MSDVLTLPLRSVVTTTPLTRLIRLDLGARPFVFQAGQAALIGTHGQTERRPYSIASSPDDAVRHHRLEFLVKVDALGSMGPHLAGVERGTRIDFEGPSGAFTLGNAPPAACLFAAGGTVVTAGEQGAYGLTVVVRHPNGYESRYAHLASLAVREGDTVAQGQQVGLLCRAQQFGGNLAAHHTK